MSAIDRIPHPGVRSQPDANISSKAQRTIATLGGTSNLESILGGGVSMSVYSRAVLLSCAMISGIAGSPAVAQDVGGLFNLMGRVIEQDMRNQGERRRQRIEEQQYLEQQREIAREEQARIDEARRQEIILIRRMQTALGKLGFYNSAVDGDRGPGTRKAEALFASAFNVAGINLDEQNIKALEDLAALGFRSGEEYRKANAAGFTDRDSYLAATRGGFETAQDYQTARQLGFDTFEDFRLYRTSGFSEPADYRIAKTGGFSDSAEFKVASALGFAERKDYLDFKSTGLPDKRAYEAAKAEGQALQGAVEKCEALSKDGDPVQAVDPCLVAVSMGATKPLMPTLQQLALRLVDALKIERAATNNPDVQAASQSASTSPDAGTFLAQRSAIQSAQQKLSCAASFVEANWEEADKECKVAMQTGASKEIGQLKEKAGKELASVRAEAEKKELVRKAAAEAEQQRMALDAARTRLTEVMSSMTEFGSTKGVFGNAIEVAKAAIRLRQLEKSNDVAAIEQAILTAEETLKAEVDFQDFLKKKQKASQVAQVNARASAMAEIRRTEAFITQFVGRNVLHDAVNDLLTLQEKLAGAEGSGQDQQLFHAQADAKAEIERLGLASDFASFVYAENAPKAADVAEASNGLAITDGNRILLEGNAKDVVILGNFTATAPHLLVNLVGETTVDSGTAVYCWVGHKSGTPPLFDLVTPVLQKLGATGFEPSGVCTQQNVPQQDIVLIERGALLARDVLEARPLIDAFEKGDLKLIKTVSWGEVGAVAEQRQKLSDAIKRDVIAGVRSGFGFVQIENASDALCLVTDPRDQLAHDYALEVVGQELGFVKSAIKTRAVLSLDRAFAGAQKNSCNIIYARAEDLKRVFAGAEKVGLKIAVLPIWVDAKLIEEGRSAAQKSEQERQAEIASKRQEMEAAAALAVKQSSEAEVVHATMQKELRERYSQEARTAHNELSGLAKGFMNGDQAASSQFALLFPDVQQWKQGMTAGAWELDKYDDEMLDYGTADWKGRKLEAVFVKINITSKNATKGEYASTCIVTGYLIDTEFGMRRDPISAECGSSDKVLADWQAGRAFESRWTVH